MLDPIAPMMEVLKVPGLFLRLAHLHGVPSGLVGVVGAGAV